MNRKFKQYCLSLIIFITLLCIIWAGTSVPNSFVQANSETKVIGDALIQTLNLNAELIVVPVPIDDLSVLEEELNTQISNYSGQWQLYIKNLQTDMYISINSEPVKAASIIKLFNMMAFYNYIDENGLTITDKQRDMLSDMIIYSSNEASNSIVEIMGNGNFLVGAKYVTDYCKEEGYNDTSEAQRLYDTVPIGTVMTGNNRISARDCGKALEKIYNMEWVNEEYSKEMLDLLLAQYYNDKIPENLPSDVKVAHKTGQTSDIDADVGIVFSGNCDYIICIVAKDAINSTERIADISKTIYDYFNNKE